MKGFGMKQYTKTKVGGFGDDDDDDEEEDIMAFVKKEKITTTTKTTTKVTKKPEPAKKGAPKIGLNEEDDEDIKPKSKPTPKEKRNQLPEKGNDKTKKKPEESKKNETKVSNQPKPKNNFDKEKWRELNAKVLIQDANKPWECERKFYDDKLQELKKNNQKFVDDSFPPTINSLVTNPKKSESPLVDYKTWFRIPELYPKKKLIISKTIDPNDIKQGGLGNCYFMSTLSSLAEFPDRVHRLIEDQVVNDKGCYFVRICQDGIWRYILIDDFFPCSEQKIPAFAQPSIESEGEIEIWALLLEKAWAKIFGSFETVEGGLTAEVLHDLTGAPCEDIFTADDDTWDRLNDANSKDYVITAGCGNDVVQQEQFQEVGLIPAHAYSLINCYELESKYSKEKVKLVEMRNPWGQFEWNGEWCDNWDGWKPEYKKKYNVGADDGRFFMSLVDFASYFETATVCKIHDDYYYVATPIRHLKNRYSTRNFSLKEKTHCFLMLTQYDDRHFRSAAQRKEYEYAVSRILLAKRVDDQWSYIKGICDQARNIFLEIDLDEGEYLIVGCLDWQDKVFDVTLSYYGSTPTEFERARYKETPEILNEVLQNMGIEVASDTIDKPNYTQYCCINLRDGVVIYTFENTSNKSIDIKKNFSKLDRTIFELIGVDDDYNVTVNLAAKQIKALVFRVKDIYIDLNSSNYKGYGFD